MLADQTIVITGVTGSLGSALARRLLAIQEGAPRAIIGISRDEEKQQRLRQEIATEVAAGTLAETPIDLRLGDVRDPATIARALRGADVVLHAAALKQVPVCERSPEEAVRTNIGGPAHIVRAIVEHALPVAAVVGVSTDKACEPASVLGMTKAVGERIFVAANLDAPDTRFVNVRPGNLLGSRGSVLPLWREQIARGGPVTITDPTMTRFLLTIDRAVDAMLFALEKGLRGETIVPRAPAVRLGDLAAVLIGDAAVELERIGARAGEKRHEMLVSAEEAPRTTVRGDHYVIAPDLPPLPRENLRVDGLPLKGAVTSDRDLLTGAELEELLARA